VVGMEGTRWL